MKKIIHAPDYARLNLRVEYDLFCPVHMWWVVSMLNSLRITQEVFFAVATAGLDQACQLFSNGYGTANAQALTVCDAKSISVTKADIRFGQQLRQAYKNGNLEALTKLSRHPSVAFPSLQEVVKAPVDRCPTDGTKGRPAGVIDDITKNIATVFRKCSKNFGTAKAYGLGAMQVTHLYGKAMHYRSQMARSPEPGAPHQHIMTRFALIAKSNIPTAACQHPG